MLVASMLSLVNQPAYFQWSFDPYFAVGFLCAFLFALLSIRFSLKLLRSVFYIFKTKRTELQVLSPFSHLHFSLKNT